MTQSPFGTFGLLVLLLWVLIVSIVNFLFYSISLLNAFLFYLDFAHPRRSLKFINPVPVALLSFRLPSPGL